MNARKILALCWLFLALCACSTPIGAPIANAGSDQSGLDVGAIVQLDGSQSSDPAGLSLSYAWRLSALPAGSKAAIVAADTAQPYFVADQTGTFTVSLLVSNGVLASDPAAVNIAVGACGSAANAPVVASIAAAPAKPNVGDAVALSATVSDKDIDSCKLPRTLSYAWSLTKTPPGSTASLLSPATTAPSFAPDKDGGYQVTLVVTDDLGHASKPKSLAVSVGNCGTQPPVVAMIQATPPSPATGQTVGFSATITDADTSMPCGKTETYTYDWSLVAAPFGSTAQLNLPNAANPSFVADKPGQYGVRLVATDADGHKSAPVFATVTVSTCGSNPPVVTTLQAAPPAPGVGAPVQLSAAISDADALAPCSIVESFAYEWQLLALPNGSKAALNGPAVSNPSFTPDVPGDYLVGLVVADAQNLKSAAKTLKITASSCGGNPPVVSLMSASPASPNTLQAVQLSATISDADMVAPCNLPESFAYAWSIQSAPIGSAAALNLPQASNPSFTPDVPGDYVLALTVTDAQNLKSAPQTLTVTASTCGNANPVAQVQELVPDPVGPGCNIIAATVGIGTIVQLSGQASTDADSQPPCNLNDPLSYDWFFTALPAGSQAQLNNNAVINPSFQTDARGQYVIGLVVTDSTNKKSGACTITVNADPIFQVNLPAGFSGSTLGFGGTDGFSNPRGVTETDTGAIAVVMAGTNRIRELSGGLWSTLTSGGLLGAGAGPEDIVFDPDLGARRFFVTAGADRLITVSTLGAQTGCVGGGGRDLRGVAMATVTSFPCMNARRVLVADRGNNVIDFVDPKACTVATTNDFAGGVGGAFSNPWGIWGQTIANTDFFFATDRGNPNLLRNTNGGCTTNAFATNDLVSNDPAIIDPRDVVTTPCPTPKLIVAEHAAGELLLIPNGVSQPATVIVSGMQAPTGLWFEDANDLLVTDEGNNALYRIKGNFCSL